MKCEDRYVEKHDFQLVPPLSGAPGLAARQPVRYLKNIFKGYSVLTGRLDGVGKSGDFIKGAFRRVANGALARVGAFVGVAAHGADVIIHVFHLPFGGQGLFI